LGNSNTIELRAKDVGETWGAADHLFLVYTNNKGEQFYLAGYPERYQPGNWGKIIMKGGEYNGNSSDWKPYIRIATVSGDPQSIYRLYQDLKTQFQRIVNAKIPYNLRQNSNSAAMTAFRNGLRQMGIDFRLPGDVYAPGSENDLTRFFRRISLNQLDPVASLEGVQENVFQPDRAASEPVVTAAGSELTLKLASVNQRLAALVSETPAASQTPSVRAHSPQLQATLERFRRLAQESAAHQPDTYPEPEQPKPEPLRWRGPDLELG